MSPASEMMLVVMLLQAGHAKFGELVGVFCLFGDGNAAAEKAEEGEYG